jgi:hypothetical protein
LFVINDLHLAFPGCSVVWTLVDPQGRKLCEEHQRIDVAEDSLVSAGRVEWAFPRDAERGTYAIRLNLLDARDQEISSNSYEVLVV